MYSLSCKDIDPTVDCHFVAEGQTEDEVVQKMTQHAQEAHADKVKSMLENMSMDEMKAMLRSKAKKM